MGRLALGGSSRSAINFLLLRFFVQLWVAGGQQTLLRLAGNHNSAAARFGREALRWLGFIAEVAVCVVGCARFFRDCEFPTLPR